MVIYSFRYWMTSIFRAFRAAPLSFSLTHTKSIDLPFTCRHNFSTFAQSSVIILKRFHRASIIDGFSQKIMLKLCTINRIFADYLPLNDLDTSCYGQKQMKKIHCFDVFVCVYLSHSWHPCLSHILRLFAARAVISMARRPQNTLNCHWVVCVCNG